MKSTMLITTMFCIFVFTSCETSPSKHITVVDNTIVKLNDAPAIEFSKSGWSYSNITNPFLITPDYLDNAMIGISRMKPGEKFPHNGPTVPTLLDSNSIKQLISKKLSDISSSHIAHELINDRDVIVANYSDENYQVIEFAFELKGYLIHVLLRAKQGSYFNSGTIVAYNLVRSLKAQP